MTRGKGGGWRRDQERDAKIRALHLAGHSYAEIGARLGVTKQRAWQLVQRVCPPDPEGVWRELP